MAQAIFDAVGCGRTDVIAYWPHALQMTLITSIPTALLNALLTRVALEKKAEEEGKKDLKNE